MLLLMFVFNESAQQIRYSELERLIGNSADGGSGEVMITREGNRYRCSNLRDIEIGEQAVTGAAAGASD